MAAVAARFFATGELLRPALSIRAWVDAGDGELEQRWYPLALPTETAAGRHVLRW